jgi:acyl carrier protein
MNESAVQEYIIEKISDKLLLFGIGRQEVDEGFDLVKSGLLDSMAFVDLVAAIEGRFSVEIDFEKATANDDFTLVGGLAGLIIDALNAK